MTSVASHRVQYAKQKEIGLTKKLSKLGYRIIDRTGGRYTKCGDVLVELNGKTIRFDHKSTSKQRETVRFDFNWYWKLYDESKKDDAIKGIFSIPVISVSTFQSRMIATMSTEIFQENNASLVIHCKEDQKGVTIKSSDIRDVPVIKCGDIYIARLEVLTSALKSM